MENCGNEAHDFFCENFKEVLNAMYEDPIQERCPYMVADQRREFLFSRIESILRAAALRGADNNI